jgi:hypothetical protein
MENAKMFTEALLYEEEITKCIFVWIRISLHWQLCVDRNHSGFYRVHIARLVPFFTASEWLTVLLSMTDARAPCN